MALRRSPLRRKSPPRKQPDELERMEAFKAAALTPRGPGYDLGCLACGNLLGIDWHAHHVVTLQHIRRAGGDVWDPRNAMRLCGGPGGCHDAHHSRQRPIPLSAVPAAAVQFAWELLGPGPAAAYLERLYDCSGRKPDIAPAPTAMLPQQNPHRWMGY